LGSRTVQRPLLVGGASLFLMGGLRLEVDGQLVAPTLCGQRVLAFLALAGARLRSVVAGSLWPDVAEAQALASLRTAMWRLDRDVPGIVIRAGGNIALASWLSVDFRDLVAFAERLLGAPPSVSGLQEAGGGEDLITVSLTAAGAGCDLLPGWYDDWVLFERERVRQLRVHALEAVSYHLLLRREFAWALDAAIQAVRWEPLRESGRRAVIEVHLAEGNVAEAVGEYRRYRTCLMDQLGLEPTEGFVEWLTAQLGTSAAQGLLGRGTKARSDATLRSDPSRRPGCVRR
jgi:DNA-binding SARP family transcriptional activator